MFSQFSPFIFEIVLGIIILILVGTTVRLNIKLKKLLLGKDAKSLEDSIIKGNLELEKLNQFKSDTIEYFKNLEKRLGRSIQAVETLRYNPFKGTGDGGNQSFSTTLLSQNGDGVIISSIHSRDRISVFGKPVQKFESGFDLTPEETEVLDSAKKNLK